jgi:nucleoid DNA-binding protein
LAQFFALLKPVIPTILNKDMEEFKGLPGIEKIHEKKDAFPVDVSEVQDIIDAVASSTNLSQDQSTRIVRLFFEELRNSILKGEAVSFPRLGSFFISSPMTNNNVKRVFPKFEPSLILIKKLRNKDGTDI